MHNYVDPLCYLHSAAHKLLQDGFRTPSFEQCYSIPLCTLCATLCIAHAWVAHSVNSVVQNMTINNVPMHGYVCKAVHSTSSAMHYGMYITIMTVLMRTTVCKCVNSANSTLAFRLLHCAHLCAQPFPLIRPQRRTWH